MNKIFNWNALKISYSCTDNISKIIYNHNKNLINKSLIDNQRIDKLCRNCRNKEDSEKLIYQATIFPMKNRKEEWVHIGISAGNREQRYYRHRHSFSNHLLKNLVVLEFEK